MKLINDEAHDHKTHSYVVRGSCSYDGGDMVWQLHASQCPAALRARLVRLVQGLQVGVLGLGPERRLATPPQYRQVALLTGHASTTVQLVPENPVTLARRPVSPRVRPKGKQKGPARMSHRPLRLSTLLYLLAARLTVCRPYRSLFSPALRPKALSNLSRASSTSSLSSCSLALLCSSGGGASSAIGTSSVLDGVTSSPALGNTSPVVVKSGGILPGGARSSSGVRAVADS